MKKLLLISLIAVLATGCNKQVQKSITYFQKHCGETRITARPDGKYELDVVCKDLLDTRKAQKYIHTSNLCIVQDSSAHVYGKIVSSDSIPSLRGFFGGIRLRK